MAGTRCHTQPSRLTFSVGLSNTELPSFSLARPRPGYVVPVLTPRGRSAISVRMGWVARVPMSPAKYRLRRHHPGGDAAADSSRPRPWQGQTVVRVHFVESERGGRTRVLEDLTFHHERVEDQADFDVIGRDTEAGAAQVSFLPHDPALLDADILLFSHRDLRSTIWGELIPYVGNPTDLFTLDRRRLLRARPNVTALHALRNQLWIAPPAVVALQVDV
jgi:hypothetical protein